MEDELDAILSQLNYDDLSFFDAPFLLNDYSTDSALSANNHTATDSASSNSYTDALLTHAHADLSASSALAPLPPNQPHPTTTTLFGKAENRCRRGGSQKESCS